MRSESESDSLIAFPRSCILLLRLSSNFGPFRLGNPCIFLFGKMQLIGQTFRNIYSPIYSIVQSNPGPYKKRFDENRVTCQISPSTCHLR